jgi:DNA-binding transcriptional LysR family regulator
MDAGDLRIFQAVARLGGMNRAGTRLFHRNSRGVKLTEAGERLLFYAVRIAQLLKEARLAVADDGKPKGAFVGRSARWKPRWRCGCRRSLPSPICLRRPMVPM